MSNYLKTISRNFVEVFRDWRYALAGVGIFVVMGTLFTLMTNEDIIYGNFGQAYFLVTEFFQWFIVLLFSIFVPVTLYKFLMFNSFSYRENSTSFLGTLFGVLVGGCAACSITLASYVGLAGLIGLLPWYGLELKILGAILLLYAVLSGLKNLKQCKVPLKKR